MWARVLSLGFPLFALSAAAQYYSATFDNDLDGWTAENLQGTLDWAWTNAGPGSDVGDFAVPNIATSTPSGWAMIDDDLLVPMGIPSNSVLVSPVIDLALAPAHLMLTFDQYAQKKDPGYSKMFVGVSTNGITWAEVELNKNITHTGRPNPEHMEVDISPWIALDPENVRVRFRYSSVGDDGWQVDNVSIVEVPENDMRIISTRLTDYDWNETYWDHISHSIYPMEQLAPFQFGATIVNMGSVPQTAVKFVVDVTGPDGLEYTDTVAYGESIEGDTLRPWLPGFVPSGGVGTYSVTYQVIQDQPDDVPLNNSTTATFEVSQATWATDNGVMDYFAMPGNHPSAGHEVGVIYQPTNDGSSVYAVQVALYQISTIGMPIYGIVYDQSNDVVGVTEDHIVQDDETNDYGSSNFITLHFTAPVPLQAGVAYGVMVGHYGTGAQLAVGTSGLCLPNMGLVHYPTYAEWYWSLHTPMVRALLSADVGVDEMADASQNVRCYPNPFSSTTEVHFNLEQATHVRAELRDALGRLVRAEELGMLPAGEQRWTIDGDGLCEGLYHYDIVVNDQRLRGNVVLVR